MTLEAFLEKLKRSPEEIGFSDTLAIIETYYSYTPTAFKNGNVENAAGQNEGSCKILAFARLHQLTPEQTLHCFGDYYRKEVLGDPAGNSHQNIRQFMKTGWAGITFDYAPLAKASG